MELSQNAREDKESSKQSSTFNENSVLINEEPINYVINIIKQSEKYCFLVTPFIDSIAYWKNFKEYINKAHEKNVKIFFIFKKPNEKIDDRDKKNTDWDKIEEIKKKYKDEIDLFLVDSLHSKIYLNEKCVLITSANLQTYSIHNNKEIGYLFNEPAASNYIVNNVICKDILKSEGIEHTKGKWADWISEGIKNGKILDDNPDKDDNFSHETNLVENKNDNHEQNTLSSELSANDNSSENYEQKGHCMSCNMEIPYNRKLSFCESCFNNKDKKAKYCHMCGKETRGLSEHFTLCESCYRRPRNVSQ